MGTGKFAEPTRLFVWGASDQSAPLTLGSVSRPMPPPRASTHRSAGTPRTHAAGEGHASRGHWHGHGAPPTPAGPRPLIDPRSGGGGEGAALKAGGLRWLRAPAVGAGKDVGAAPPAPRPSLPASAPWCRERRGDLAGGETRGARAGPHLP